MITLCLCHPQGGTRRYRVDRKVFNAGPRPGCDIPIHSDALGSRGFDWELRFDWQEKEEFLRVRANEGWILLDGQPIPAEGRGLPVGSYVDIGPVRLQVEAINVPGAAAKMPEAGAEERLARPRAPEAAPAAGGTENRTGSDFLQLFLQPIVLHLNDEQVSEIMVNGPGQVFVEKEGRLKLVDAKFPNEESLVAAMKNIARTVGRRLDSDNPRLDARLPDGSRVHAVIPPLARNGTVVAIRKFSREGLNIEKLVALGSLDAAAAALLKAIVLLKKNVLVSGPTSSGKTSVLNVLSQFIPKEERILVIEDASELQLSQEHLVRFETRKADEHGQGEVTIRDLVHSALRLRPDRLVVGEIRGGEALDLLQAFNTGHAGSMSTIHANGPVDALWRMETCALLSGIEIPLVALREQVASAVQAVIHTARLPDGTRKITHVAEVLPLAEGKYRVNNLVEFKLERVDEQGRIIGTHRLGDTRPSFLEEAKLRGYGDLLHGFK